MNESVAQGLYDVFRAFLADFRRTNGRTDEPSYTALWTHLKICSSPIYHCLAPCARLVFICSFLVNGRTDEQTNGRTDGCDRHLRLCTKNHGLYRSVKRGQTITFAY